jgi:enterochelin esterase-like enzyme
VQVTAVLIGHPNSSPGRYPPPQQALSLRARTTHPPVTRADQQATVPGVRDQCAPDPLAVSTFLDAGEEVAYGDPSVTDQQRAAAGRETVAERSRALLAGNRRRAAEQATAGRLPDDQDLVRVWWPRDLASLRARLGEGRLTVWAEGDVLHVLWQGQADEVQLAAGIQPRLWPVEGAEGLWEASLNIRRLDEAVISIAVLPRRAGDDPFGSVSDTLVWRGPRAPAALPAAASLTGTVQEHTLPGGALGAPRRLTVYRPPHHQGRLPACVLADGASARSFAEVLEPAILAGTVPPVLLVGVYNAVDPASPWPDRRAQEYVPGQHPRRFAAHLGFVTDEVIPWATDQWGAAAGPWVAAGFSNGGDWAVAAAQRRPEVFAAVAAFSVGVVPHQITSRARAAGVRHYLAAGTLEPGFRQATRQWAQRLRRAGLDCRHHEWVGGHDHLWWAQQLPAALGWLLIQP